jgi:hypothetical protein
MCSPRKNVIYSMPQDRVKTGLNIDPPLREPSQAASGGGREEIGVGIGFTKLDEMG